MLLEGSKMSKRKLFVISGSPRKEESVTHALTEAIIEQASRDFDVSAWKLGYRPVSEAMPEFHKDPFAQGNPKEVIELAEEVKVADVIVLCTPVYNGSYSAHLKNALDCLWWDAFRGKQVILASHGSMTAGIPLSHLQDVVRTMQGTVVNSLIVVGRESFEGVIPKIVDENAVSRIKNVIKGL